MGAIVAVLSVLGGLAILLVIVLGPDPKAYKELLEAKASKNKQAIKETWGPVKVSLLAGLAVLLLLVLWLLSNRP